MTKVFIGGSRKIISLNPDIKARLDNIIEKGYAILIGDANGADKAVQKYLHENAYQNVQVFCMDQECRNNIGNWESTHITSPQSRKDFSYYSIKDAEMAKEAEYGFMLWEGKSNGTLNNMVNLLKANKKVLVYFLPQKAFFKLLTFSDLEKLLQECEKEAVQAFEEKLNLSQILKAEKQKQLQPGFHFV
ncbi:MAG: hypothetical protein HUU38_31865 [Anaerolineales bacterium]|nr:hypothetical protein [Anaerolineales bacterium]